MKGNLVSLLHKHGHIAPDHRGKMTLRYMDTLPAHYMKVHPDSLKRAEELWKIVSPEDTPLYAMRKISTDSKDGLWIDMVVLGCRSFLQEGTDADA